MMCKSVLVILALAVSPVAAETVTPVQKVLQMMEDMLAKGKKEKNEEMVRFSTYKQFCESTAGEKTRNIAAGKDSIIQLKADISKADADASVLAEEISVLSSDIDGYTGEKDEATSIRDKEHADYLAVHADYTSAMDAVDRALQVLASSPGQSFIQVQESLMQAVPAKAKMVLMSFLQGKPRDPSEAMLEEQIMSESGAKLGQTPKTYESSSGGVIKMVEELGDKFKAERYELEKEETKKEHASQMIVQGLTDSIEKSTRQMDMKTATKAQREKDSSEATGDLSDTTATLAADEEYLADLTTQCNTKASDFEKRQELRAGEIEAISKAIEIMSSGAIAGGTKYLPSLVQTGSSLAQLRADRQSPLQKTVASFLKDRAEKSNSRILSLIATRVAEDPFKKIKKMIQDMVSKLMEEANEEAEHKGFCDTEMGTNKNTRDTKSDQVAELTAQIEELTAHISQLAEKSAELSDNIAALDAAMSKATMERTAEKEKNTATIADAKVAAAATARALTVLKEFYATASQATALAQIKQPETFDKPYTGMGGSSTGVVGMLEVIESDFVRLDTETTAAEDKASKDYEKFMQDSTTDKKVKETDLKHATSTKVEKESDKEAATKDLKGTQEELDAALAYYEKLKPSCVDAGESYEERVARRKEEIESLQDALKILSGEA